MEELIGFVIGAIVVIAIIGLLLGVIGVLLQAAWLSWPAWVVAGVVMFIVWQWHSSRKNERTDSYLLETIKARCIGDKLHWSINDAVITSYAESEYSDIAFIAPVLGGIASLVMFVIIQSNGWFSGMLFQFFWFKDKADMVDPGIGSIAGFIATATIVTAIAFFLHPKKTAEGLLKERANELISRINTSLERTHELDSLESSIKAINVKLNISFPADFKAEIQQFVDANTQTLLRDVTPLNNRIADLISRAKENLTQLEKASDLYSLAKDFYTKTVREVSKTGSPALLTQLDYIHTFLNSENLKDVLQKKDWSNFQDVVNGILDELVTIKKAATNYLEEEEEIVASTETEEERASRILGGVPLNATADQIKRMYKALAAIFHPDSKTVKDDTRMKEINWAYDVLMKKFS
jgi:hypothetical protein